MQHLVIPYLLLGLDALMIERLIVIFVTFLCSSTFSTILTLYVTRDSRKATTLSLSKNDEIRLSEMVSKYATNVTQDAERLLNRLEKTEDKLEKTEQKLERVEEELRKCIEECKKSRQG